MQLKIGWILEDRECPTVRVHMKANPWNENQFRYQTHVIMEKAGARYYIHEVRVDGKLQEVYVDVWHKDNMSVVINVCNEFLEPIAYWRMTLVSLENASKHYSYVLDKYYDWEKGQRAA